MLSDDGKTQGVCTTDECSHYFAVEVYITLVNGVNYPSYTCETLVELDGR